MNSTINNQRSTAFPHEKLEVWQAAKSLAVCVYQITTRFPREERFGLVDLVFLTKNDYQDVRQSVLKLVKRISALRNSQLKRTAQ